MADVTAGGVPPTTLHLFLDTNTYLGFFKLSDDDLVELEKLAIAVRSGRTALYLTRQVRDEFKRNRANVIRESLKWVEDSRIPTSFPRLLTNLESFAGLRTALAQASQAPAARRAAPESETSVRV